MAVRVLLVDDQTLFLQGMRALLSRDPHIDVVGEARDGHECLRLVRTLRPDVILMDLRMPKMDGVEAIRRLRAASVTVQTVVLTTFDDDELVFEALKEGACSYLLKDAPVEDIAQAIVAAARGESVLASRVAHKVVSEFARMAQLANQRRADHLGLSPRETEITRLLAQGRSNREIASALHLAEGTVKNHLTSIFGKLGVRDRTQAALVAREHGLV